MLIGVPTEIKPQENRVGLTPAGAKQYVQHGHRVIVQQDAGAGSGLSDEEYIQVGAQIVPTAEEVWGQADMICKVKEPLAAEYPKIRPGQILFTYLHLAPDLPQTEALLASGCVAIAYETIEVNGALPLLAPMSEVAGRLSIQAGAHCLEKNQGGHGVLLGGVRASREQLDEAVDDGAGGVRGRRSESEPQRSLRRLKQPQPFRLRHAADIP